MSRFAYKIARACEWNAHMSKGRFIGSAKDVQDGFVHLSSGAQLRETADKWFAAEPHQLIVACIDLAWYPAGQVRWEKSRRHDQLFPHGAFASNACPRLTQARNSVRASGAGIRALGTTPEARRRRVCLGF